MVRNSNLRTRLTIESLQFKIKLKMAIPYKEVIETKSVKFFKNFFNLIGIYKMPSNSRFYNIWPYCLHPVFTVLYVSAMIINISLNLKIGDLYMTLTEVAMFGKMVSVFRLQSKIQALLERIETDKVFYLKDDSELKIVVSKMKSFEWIYNFYKYVSLNVCVMGAVQALFR